MLVYPTLKMKYFQVCLLFSCVMLCSSNENVGIHYKFYSGISQETSCKFCLIECLQGVASSMDFIGVQFNPVTLSCKHLHKTWFNHRTFDEGTQVLVKLNVDIQFNSTVSSGNLPYWTQIPGKMKPNSSISIYVTTLQADATYFFVLSNDNDIKMTTRVDHETSTIIYYFTNNNTIISNQQTTTDVQLLTNVMLNFTYVALEGGLKVFMDNNDVGVVDVPGNLMDVTDIARLAIWSQTGTSLPLQRVTMNFSDP